MYKSIHEDKKKGIEDTELENDYTILKASAKSRCILGNINHNPCF